MHTWGSFYATLVHIWGARLTRTMDDSVSPFCVHQSFLLKHFVGTIIHHRKGIMCLFTMGNCAIIALTKPSSSVSADYLLMVWQPRRH